MSLRELSDELLARKASVVQGMIHRETDHRTTTLLQKRLQEILEEQTHRKCQRFRMQFPNNNQFETPGAT